MGYSYYTHSTDGATQMSTVVVGAIEPEQFALDHTFEEVPELVVEAKQSVDHGDGVVIPMLWVRGPEGRSIPDILRADPSTRAVDQLADVGGEYLFRIDWADAVAVTLEGVLNERGTLLDLSADRMAWQFRVLYPDRDDAPVADRHSLDFDVRRIGQFEIESAVKYGLTDKQIEALHIGWRRGYFDVPRRVGIEELSEDLGITHQATSERLRRGQSSLIAEAFGLHGSAEDDDLGKARNAVPEIASLRD